MGKPLRMAQLKFAPDNVRWTSDNRLITAGMLDDEPACGGAPRDEKGIFCSKGYVVVTTDPRTMAVTDLARGPATPSFTGTAIAMRVGDDLWLGSTIDWLSALPSRRAARAVQTSRAYLRMAGRPRYSFWVMTPSRLAS